MKKKNLLQRSIIIGIVTVVGFISFSVRMAGDLVRKTLRGAESKPTLQTTSILVSISRADRISSCG